jgi:hypothetical protein
MWGVLVDDANELVEHRLSKSDAPLFSIGRFKAGNAKHNGALSLAIANKLVSGEHCVVEWSAETGKEGAVLHDLSSNGTWVGGERVKAAGASKKGGKGGKVSSSKVQRISSGGITDPPKGTKGTVALTDGVMIRLGGPKAAVPQFVFRFPGGGRGGGGGGSDGEGGGGGGGGGDAEEAEEAEEAEDVSQYAGTVIRPSHVYERIREYMLQAGVHGDE